MSGPGQRLLVNREERPPCGLSSTGNGRYGGDGMWMGRLAFEGKTMKELKPYVAPELTCAGRVEDVTESFRYRRRWGRGSSWFWNNFGNWHNQGGWGNWGFPGSGGGVGSGSGGGDSFS